MCVRVCACVCVHVCACVCILKCAWMFVCVVLDKIDVALLYKHVCQLHIAKRYVFLILLISSIFSRLVGASYLHTRCDAMYMYMAWWYLGEP